MRFFVVGTLGIVLWITSPGGTFLDPLPGERHFGKLLQLTDGGENAEAYFSFDERRLIFQSTREPYRCDQIFSMKLDGSDVRLMSTGRGRTTCAYFLPGDRRIVYSSTREGNPQCPPKPDFSQGYVWALYEDFDIYSAATDGSDVRPLTRSRGYDAEATVSPDGKHIVFTSVRDGDLELYSMDLDGSNLRRLTFERGYDGGAFYSLDSTKIVYRAHHPKDGEDIQRYSSLLERGLIEPRSLEIMVMNADGSGKALVTHNGHANFAPFFHPNGRQIIFSSNLHDPRGRNFDLYLINTDGTGLERITYSESFDGFPMFNRDGSKLVFASNRNSRKPGETNVFVTDWE